MLMELRCSVFQKASALACTVVESQDARICNLFNRYAMAAIQVSTLMFFWIHLVANSYSFIVHFKGLEIHLADLEE